MSVATGVDPLRLGVMRMLRSAAKEVEVARAAEAAGFWGVGLGDTAPHLYQDTHVTGAACLAATESIHVGPTVTNTVVRHWSALGTAARTFEELHPGRFFAGIGTGDGAVHSVGLAPSSWDRLEADVAAAAGLLETDIPIHVAASGPRGAAAAGRCASDLLIGTGFSVEAVRQLSEVARAARTAAGLASDLRIWIVAPTFLTPDEEATAAARRALRGAANGYARFSFASTFEGKAVPERWHQPLRDGLARYDFGNHGTIGDASPNSHLFDDDEDLQDHIVDRMMLIGTPRECAERLTTFSREAGLDGVWLALLPGSPADDPVDLVRSAGAAFSALLPR